MQTPLGIPYVPGSTFDVESLVCMLLSKLDHYVGQVVVELQWRKANVYTDIDHVNASDRRVASKLSMYLLLFTTKVKLMEEQLITHAK